MRNKSQNSKRGKQRNPRNSKSFKEKDVKYTEGKGDGTNNPEWYSRSQELLRDAASIPFSWAVGNPLHSSVKMNWDSIPGVLSAELTPVVGTSLNETSPINVAASAIYSNVRHANSGHSNYDAPDLMIYLLAMSNVYSFVTWCQRVYGLTMLYDQRNRYIPKTLVSANAVSFESIRDNLANFRYWLNTFINKVASLAVPNDMPIFQRLAFLYSNVYSEGPSIKDQLYQYVPYNNAWWKFNLDSDSRGQLTLDAMTLTAEGNTKASFSDIKTYGESLFNAIWEQEDFGIMSGDILKAYQGNIIKLSPIPEAYVILPLHDELVLHQFKNAKLCSVVSVGKVSQTATGLIAASIIMDASGSARNKAIQYADALRTKVLSTGMDDPGPDIVIESTRLMYGYDSYSGVFTSGTEICRSLKFWRISNGTPISQNLSCASVAYSTASGLTSAQAEDNMKRMHMIKQFKYAPEIIAWGYNGDTIDDSKAYRIWDVDNYAVLDNEDISKLHETALLSLFAIDAIAKIS